jgi:hypothetical protein
LHSFLSFDFIWFDFFVGVSLAVVATRHLLCGTWFSQAEFSKKFIRFSVFSYKIYSVFIKFRMNYVGETGAKWNTGWSETVEFWYEKLV